MKKLFRITSVTILLGIITALIITIPAFSEMNISAVGRWNFDGNALDSSGKGNNGTLYGSPLPVYVSNGVHLQGLSFNGSNYVQVPDSPSLNFGTGDYSISGWVQTTSTQLLNTIIDKRQTGSGPGYHVVLHYGRLLLQIADSTGYENYTDSSILPLLNDGALHSFVITVDQYYQLEIRFYIDGVLKRTFYSTTHRGSSSNTSPLYIGKHSADPRNYFTGTLDEVTLYNYALCSKEAAQIFLNGSCVGRWALDQTTWDSSGNKNNGYIYPREYVSGKFNLALFLKGDRYVSVPDSPSLNVGAGDFSVSFWINKPYNSPSDVEYVIDKMNPSEYRGFEVYMYYSQPKLFMHNGIYGTDFPSNWSLSYGSWHFLVFTVDRDSTSGVKVYVDGTLTNTLDPTPYQGNLDSGSPLILGGYYNATSNNYYGYLDEVKMYNRVLTPEEISLQYYN